MAITRHRLGFLCTNAGVDRSNAAAPGDDAVVTLPPDPDASARRIRERLRALAGCDIAVIVSDSFGLPDRRGPITLSIGLAGIRRLEERPSRDLYGRPADSALMLVDALAGAAGIVMGETDEAVPAVVVRGARYTRDEAASVRGLLV
jgi:coenzyme F420-0:L-glutamate ligase/coenzyme F420-1:gamma-L-glutamate ligase